MKNEYIIRKIKSKKDWLAATKIFNFYAVTDFSVYTAEPMEDDFLERTRLSISEYPFYVIEFKSEIIGFGCLSPYSAAQTLKQSAIISYFIYEEHTRKGLGKKLLNNLIEDGKRMGINNILAHISSKNRLSIKFHEKNGFVKCGHFKQMGIKFDSSFDVIWMQYFIN